MGKGESETRKEKCALFNWDEEDERENGGDVIGIKGSRHGLECAERTGGILIERERESAVLKTIGTAEAAGERR